MSENEIEPTEEVVSKLDKFKDVAKRNWKPFTVAVVGTGVTLIVTKRVTTRYMGYYTMPLDKYIKEIYLPNLRRILGPNWKGMVRCVENGRVFFSAEEAAKKMNLSKQHMSQHLSGKRHNVGGYHFTR